MSLWAQMDYRLINDKKLIEFHSPACPDRKTQSYLHCEGRADVWRTVYIRIQLLANTFHSKRAHAVCEVEERRKEIHVHRRQCVVGERSNIYMTMREDVRGRTI